MPDDGHEDRSVLIRTGAGTLPPSGRHIETWATIWMRWADGVRVHERHHRDVLTLLTQVGALPAPVTG